MNLKLDNCSLYFTVKNNLVVGIGSADHKFKKSVIGIGLKKLSGASLMFFLSEDQSALESVESLSQIC